MDQPYKNISWSIISLLSFSNKYLRARPEFTVDENTWKANAYLANIRLNALAYLEAASVMKKKCNINCKNQPYKNFFLHHWRTIE
jgi:hypothetical protein